MTNATSVAQSPGTPAGLGVDRNAKPAFELILAGLESAPPDQPFESEQVKRLGGLHKAAREHYSRILNGMVGAELGAPGLPVAVVRGAQMLHRRLANAYGQAALRLALKARAAGEQDEVAALAISSLQARAEEIKWHAFERTTPHAASWQSTNALFLGVESLGVEGNVLDTGSSCVDAFAQCVLLATLNVGILSAPEVEIAHRWLAVAAIGLRVEPFFDPEIHWYQIDLEHSRGPERISPGSAVSDTTRFLAVSALGNDLAQARAKLYAGELSVGATPNRIVALHFGAFLDLAERLWSPDWRRASWRAARTPATGENIEVVVGFERVVAAIGAEDDASPAPKTSSWGLRDKSDRGFGAIVPEDAGLALQPGALVAFRASAEEDWELGSIIRRVRSADETFWQVGIKRVCDSPVVLKLQSRAGNSRLENAPARTPMAIYATVNSSAGRVDSVLLLNKDFANSNDYSLPTRGGAFRIRMNRVVDRGDNWLRVGFEVLGKQQS